jgi:hypothetical protein
MSAQFDDWVERARRTSIESEIMRRGITLRRSGVERIGPCPRCGGDDRFSVNPKLGVWNCRHCKPADIAGDIIGLVQWLDGTEFVRAVETINQEPPPLNGHGRESGGAAPQQAPEIVAVYGYQDEVGDVLFETVRFNPKTFRQRRPNGHGGHIWSIKGVRRIPFRLPELNEAIALDRRVFIVEGEKDVLNLERMGVPATCNAMGAGAWHPDLNRYFQGADVVVIADNDPPILDKKTGKPRVHSDGSPMRAGQDHARNVCAELQGIAARVRYLDLKEAWPSCPNKGDISDWIAIGGTVEQLNAITEHLADWSPLAAPSADVIPYECPFPIDPTVIPMRPWLIAGLLLRRQITLFVAPPGSGKSLLTLQIAMLCAAATPREWGGWKPRTSYRVLVINSEEDSDEQRRRLWAAAEIMGISQSDLAGLAIAINPEDIVIGKTDARTKTVTREPMLDKIKKTLVDGRFDIVIVDPFAETWAGDENSNSEVKWAGVLWREVARSCNCAVLLVHHSRKYAGQMAGDMDAARGGGALVGIARIVCTLFSMTEEDGDRLNLAAESTKRNINEQQLRKRLLRFDDAKSNLSLLSPTSRCFYKETKRLENGDNHDGDDVGVLVEFVPETKVTAILQDVTQANRILDDIAAGVKDEEGRPIGEPLLATPKRGSKPKNWAGKIVQEHTNCSQEEAAEILEIWIKNQVLIQFQHEIKSRRTGGLSECLRVNPTSRPGTTL